MSPSGGTRERSGTICINSPRLQNEAGKLGQTIRTLIAGPSGGENFVSLGSRSMDKPSYLRLLLDFEFDSLSVANQLCEDRYTRVMHSGFDWLGERSCICRLYCWFTNNRLSIRRQIREASSTASGGEF